MLNAISALKMEDKVGKFNFLYSRTNVCSNCNPIVFTLEGKNEFGFFLFFVYSQHWIRNRVKIDQETKPIFLFQIFILT